MKLLLDTNIVIWLLNADTRLTGEARRTIDAAASLTVSAVTIWEIAIKVALGKLVLDMDRLPTLLEHAGVQQLPVTWAHARAVRDLPHHHRDPLDRLLIAQAMSEPLHLLTHDRALRAYSELVMVV